MTQFEAVRGKVAVITDSTASLPVELAQALSIGVVPVSVVIAREAFDEGEGVTPDQVADALARGVSVTTSRPSPEAFARAYRVASSYGARRIVSVHLAQELSGTYESALLASKHAPVPVTVIDARTTAMALGYAVVAAAKFAAAGVDSEAVAAAARETAEQSFLGVYVESLDYLRRGGRVSAARAIVGTALKFHPLLQVREGSVEVVERVRTRSRALRHLVQRATDVCGTQPGRVSIAIHGVGEAAHADCVAVEQALREAFGERVHELRHAPLSAALAAHIGPGTISIAVAPVLST